VDEVQVEVVEAELSKAVVEGGSDVVGSVLRVPELGGDEDVLALDALAESSLEGVGNLLLVAVDLGQIDVLVAGLEGLVNGGLDLAGLSLPCTESQLTGLLLVETHKACAAAAEDSRDRGAGVELDSTSERHDVLYEDELEL